MFKLYLKEGVLSLILLLTASSVFSQSYHYNDYRRLSLTLNGGLSLGDLNRGDYFLSSSFSTNTKNTPEFGAGIQYALTPTWSLELGYQRTQIKGKDDPFETNMNLLTLKNIINLNQIFFVNRISDRINPYLTAGFGYNIFSYSDPNEKFTNRNFGYNAGIGIAYKLTNTLDLFTHYEYHMISNSADNVVTGYGADLINMVTGGIRINFGRKSSKLLSWRAVPVEISPSEYNRFLAQADAIDVLKSRLNELAQRQAEREREVDQIVDKRTTETDSLKARLNQVLARTDNLEAELTEGLKGIRKVKVNPETGFAESLPSGDYVQIFATYFLDVARDVRAGAVEHLGNNLEYAEQNIFIIHRKKFYEVMIGVFDEYKQAKGIQKIMSSAHNDAYVITFPRPINLQPDFKGLKVVDENPLATQN